MNGTVSKCSDHYVGGNIPNNSLSGYTNKECDGTIAITDSDHVEENGDAARIFLY